MRWSLFAEVCGVSRENLDEQYLFFLVDFVRNKQATGANVPPTKVGFATAMARELHPSEVCDKSI